MPSLPSQNAQPVARLKRMIMLPVETGRQSTQSHHIRIPAHLSPVPQTGLLRVMQPPGFRTAQHRSDAHELAYDGLGSEATSEESDLPDIIDVVMEMGRAPEEPSTDAPPLPFRPLPIPACRLIPTRSPSALAITPRQQARPTPGGLRRRLETFLRLGARFVAARSAGRRPLHHGLRVRQGNGR